MKYNPKDFEKTLEKHAQAAEDAKTHKPKMIVYHGTGAQFSRFDKTKATQGIIWFTSDKQKVLAKEAGAQGNGFLITAEVTIKKPAGWDEYDKLLLVQLKRDYDGVILKDKDGSFDCFVFSTRQIRIIKSEIVT